MSAARAVLLRNGEGTLRPAAREASEAPSFRRTARRGVGLPVAVAVLALAGCGAGGGEPDAEQTLPPGVTVEFVQLRADVAPRQAQVHVTNDSDAPITIGDVRVEDPRFEGPAMRVVAGRTSTVPAGRSVDVRVQLPAVDCGAPEDAVPEVVLELVGEDGTAEVTASASEPLGFVAPLHERECRRERLADATTVAFTGFRASAPGAPAALELTITPTGSGAATIVGVQRTNLIDFAGATADGAFPIDVVIEPGSDGPVVVEVPLVPFRCDPHAVQEDKRGTIFAVHVDVDGERGDIDVFVGDELRGRILSWVVDWCGYGG